MAEPQACAVHTQDREWSRSGHFDAGHAKARHTIQHRCADSGHRRETIRQDRGNQGCFLLPSTTLIARLSNRRFSTPFGPVRRRLDDDGLLALRLFDSSGLTFEALNFMLLLKVDT